MKIEVRLFATLRTNREKKTIIELEPGCSPRHAAEKLNIPPEKVTMVLINGKNSTMDAIINEGDIVSFYPAIGGG
ncbi:MAG: MoaD/ThiS family protein [Syntrophomonas sp.]